MDRLDKQTLYEQLKGIQQSGAPLDTFSPILSSGFVQGLKAELAGLQREQAQLAERLGDAHPDMIKVNTSIAAAERRLNEEMAKIVDGIENDYRAAQTREKGIAEALESQKREVLELSQKSIGFNALQRDAASTQQMFDTVLQRVKETELVRRPADQQRQDPRSRRDPTSADFAAKAAQSDSRPAGRRLRRDWSRVHARVPESAAGQAR